MNEERDALFVDRAGDQVLRFISAARNLSRVGELTDEVVSLAKSGVWRCYRTALGVDEWRECELDYFLIAADLPYDDVSRVIAYSREKPELAKMMDPDADEERRRSLDSAAESWHSPVPETLTERAQRLGWTRGSQSTRMRVPPVPTSVRVKQMHGLTPDELARRSRAERIPPARRAEIDSMVQDLQGRLKDTVERRYAVDKLVAEMKRKTD